MSDTNLFEFETKQKEEPKKRPALSDDALEIITYMEQFYWENGKVPSEEILSQTLEIELFDVRKVLIKDEVIEALKSRGVAVEFRKKERVLTPKQVVLVNMLLNVGDKASLRQKLELIQVTQVQYNAWLRDPAFQGYLKMRTEQMFQFADHDAYKSLVQAVQEGDVPAMKLFFEMRGIYNPRVTVDINIETVVLKVVEVVTRHIKDPYVLEAIARDIEKLEVPRTGAAIGI